MLPRLCSQLLDWLFPTTEIINMYSNGVSPPALKHQEYHVGAHAVLVYLEYD